MKALLCFFIYLSCAVFSVAMEVPYSSVGVGKNWDQMAIGIANSAVHVEINELLHRRRSNLNCMSLRIEALRSSISEIENSDPNFVNAANLENHIVNAESQIKKMMLELDSLSDLSWIAQINLKNTHKEYDQNRIVKMINKPVELKQYEPYFCCKQTKGDLIQKGFAVLCFPLWCPLFLISFPCICIYKYVEECQSAKSASSITTIEAKELSPQITERMQEYLESNELLHKVQEALIPLNEQLDGYRQELQKLQAILNNLKRPTQGG